MDEGIDPTNMCKRLVSSMQQKALLETVAPSAIRALFEDWMTQLEKEVLTFVKGKREVIPEVLAKEFNISLESGKYLVKRLKEERKI
ncbi:MAG: hypothetical protein AB1487_02710 [Thermodesulfobacteriota bacterium]